MTNAEKETIVRWDCEDRAPVLYTADPLQATRWTKFGYHVTVTDRSRDGTPRSWSAKGCPGCVRFRRLKDGAIVKRTTAGRNLPVQRPSRGRAASEAR
jgi:hypothetical protein